MTTHVCTLGETLGLIRTDAVGGLETTPTAQIGIGGAESNVAIGVRRLGLVSHWMGRVGADPFGRRIARDLRAEDIHTTVVVDHDAPTGLMLKTTRTAGRTAVQYYRTGSAGSRLSRGDLNLHVLRSSVVLHVTGITPSLSESARDVVFFAIDVARENGALISFDVNHRTALWGDRHPGELYRKLATISDVVFAGRDEAELVAGSGDDISVTAQRIKELGCDEVVLKLGEDGSFGLIQGREYSSAAFPVSVVDTVGAGDAFVAAYLYSRLTGEPPQDRLRLANLAGARACEEHGDWESLPYFDDVASDENRDPVRR